MHPICTLEKAPVSVGVFYCHLMIYAETVEKHLIRKFGACKLLISLHAKLPKSPFLDFFDTYEKATVK
jgi:hypothetical protein